jgi:hypothetical protein
MDPAPFLHISDLFATELQRPANGGLRSLAAIGATSHMQAALALRVNLANWIDAGMRDEMLQSGLETLNTCQTLLFTFTDPETFARFLAIEKGTPEKSAALRSAIKLSQLEIQKLERLESLPSFAQFCLATRQDDLRYWKKVETRLGLMSHSEATQGKRTGCMGMIALFVVFVWFISSWHS